VIGAAAHSSYARASDASAGSVLPSPFSIAFVPLDDRPVTYQLPVALGTIAGQRVVTPPRALLGNYLQPGDGDAILAWLNSPETDGANALVASLDMIAYGGLVAARVPDVSAGDAYARLRTLAAARSRRSLGFAGAFGTIMRLAPTGVPQVGAAIRSTICRRMRICRTRRSRKPTVTRRNACGNASGDPCSPAISPHALAIVASTNGRCN